MSEFKKGDTVIGVEEGHGTPVVRIGERYTVEEVMIGDNLRVKNAQGVSGVWRAKRFKPVNTVDVQIKGTIKSRNNGVVTIDTEHGAVVLPEAFIPDPDLAAVREIVSLAFDSLQYTSNASTMRTGQWDKKLALALAKFKEVKNAQV